MASNIKKKFAGGIWAPKKYCEREVGSEYGITEPKPKVILMRFAYLHFTVVSYKLKEKTPTNKKITACFIAVVWNQTCNTSEVCLYFKGRVVNRANVDEFNMELIHWLFE